MRALLAVLVAVTTLGTARAAVISYDSIHGTEIGFEDVPSATGDNRVHQLESFYSALGVHFFAAIAYEPVGMPGNTGLLNAQGQPCLVAGCPVDVRVLPPVSSPFASDLQWRPMWATFDAPITQFGFLDLAPDISLGAGIFDSIRAYRAGTFMGQETFPVTLGDSNVRVAARFDTGFDLVILDRQAIWTDTGSNVFFGTPAIDNVRFAPAITGPVPEPSAWLLFALGGIAIGAHRVAGHRLRWRRDHLGSEKPGAGRTFERDTSAWQLGRRQ